MDYPILSSKGEENHICNTLDIVDGEPSIRFRGGWSNMHNLYEIVCKNEKCKLFVDQCGLGRLLEINVSKDDQQLTHAIVERFWKCTNTFHFPTFEIGLIPNDFSWLTGLEVGKGVKLDYVNWCDKENRETCLEYVENLFPNLAQLIFDQAEKKKAAKKKKALEKGKGKAKTTEQESDDEEDIHENLQPNDSEEEIGENGENRIRGLDVSSYLSKRSGGIKCVDMCDWLKTFNGKGGVAMDPYWDEIVRVFILWMIDQVLMPNSVSTTKVGWLCNFEELDLENVGLIGDLRRWLVFINLWRGQQQIEDFQRDVDDLRSMYIWLILYLKPI